MQAYLQTDPKYAALFRKIWLWEAFPGRDDLGGADTGIDLVAVTNDHQYWAIQCKCFDENTTIDKPAVDSFLATSGRQFTDENGQTGKFDYRLWISTSNKWGKNALEAFSGQTPPVIRLNLLDLEDAPVDWEKLENGIHGEAARTSKKTIRPHQQEALGKALSYFTEYDRGKLIMACGTGKTYTSLKIAEQQTAGKGFVLFLVPSIALLAQTLREWSADADYPVNPLCICSDPKVSRSRSKNDDSESFSVIDLALPATTDVDSIVNQFKRLEESPADGMTVVFSTYQSIAVISEAQQILQKSGSAFAGFDLIICDEAHRTTGVTLASEDASAFVKVHDDNFIKAKKRLYMTATPRLFSDDTKSRAAKEDAVLASMDDESLYGHEIYRIGFGEAVEKDLLTDYKVLILTLNEHDVPPAVQKIIADQDNEINTDDISKLIGCINALSKQVLGDQGIIKSSDPDPMKRAVAFCQNIKVSEKITETFNTAAETYLDSLPDQQQAGMVRVSSRHIDGSMNAPQRDELLAWLKEDTTGNDCRILTNVRCLSEGVDVPSLDAVMFLSARNSQVDVVQSVGRVMRKAPGKNYGYIIIPVIVPADIPADKALDDNERYKVVWTVLNALRAHDDRFNATVNKIELNKKRPNQILVGRPAVSYDDQGRPVMAGEDPGGYGENQEIARQIAIQFEALQSVVFGRMVQKVGDRRYWEQWAKNVAEIAERQLERIKLLIARDGVHQKAFQRFLKGLQKNINPSITEQEAVEMLSQHIITRPVFEALFEDYSFVKSNPISTSMQQMLDLLEAQGIEKDTETLNQFYDSVRKRAQDIDNAEGKQRIIIELYDKFFKTAFPKMVERLGIVYTPVEVVDFIIHSVNDILKQEFGRTISDEHVHVLDPFTGTGTFITRLIQSGLIAQKDLQRKYSRELHANEIVLLAYYIAAVNIENAFHDQLTGDAPYQPFEGICLTDTFQLGETEDGEKLFSEMFPQNSKRVQAQKKAPIRIIMGNPPYSVGQNSANDNAQNQTYNKLNQRIAETYAKLTDATNKNSLYDSYIKAFRWSTDRLDKNGGIICFVSNGAWLDGNSADGFRKAIEKEFTSIYVFNLRGNARTSGELRQKEAGNVFGSGSRTPIAVTLLVKNPKVAIEKAIIHYHDIGDYLSREEKLKIVKGSKTFANPKLELITLQPNEHGDWISVRNDAFSTFIPLDDKTQSFFKAGLYCRGLETSRDTWTYNFNNKELQKSVKTTIDFFNQETQRIKDLGKSKAENLKDLIAYDDTKISWSRAFVTDLSNAKIKTFDKANIVNAIYRPYCKQNLYFSRELNNVVSRMDSFFPNPSLKNLLICVSGVGVTKDFSCIISDIIPDLELIGKSQCFPLYYYEENNVVQKGLFDNADSASGKYIRKDGISDFILERAKKQYGISTGATSGLTKEDIFYYVYGFLHSKDYRETFANDLKKMLPRIPLLDDVKDFWAFSKAGRKLAELHLHYETVAPYPDVTVTEPVEVTESTYYVEKMRFPKKGQKDTILYNSRITVSNIPEKAYAYVVNGKSAIEWIMERYQITTHKDSGITNNPNDWASEHNQPRYILDLLLSIINVSVQTVDIVEELPKEKYE